MARNGKIKAMSNSNFVIWSGAWVTQRTRLPFIDRAKRAIFVMVLKQRILSLAVHTTTETSRRNNNEQIS